ncbi:MAG: 4-hydroxythreonine-4-phosphate dehydrogenase PdxA [Planctomycetaceae bacterium]
MPIIPIIAITAGDVAGIGPEVLVKALRDRKVNEACRSLAICDPEVLRRATELVGCASSVEIRTLDHFPQNRQELEAALSGVPPGCLLCWNPCSPALNVMPGKVSGIGGDCAFQYLSAAIQLAKSGIVDAICTAPLNKAALHAAGHHYPGHTEILAQQCGVSDFAMMLHLPESRIAPVRPLIRTPGDRSDATGHGLSIVHVTLHTSIASVPTLLTTAGIMEKTGLMLDFLKRIGCQRAAIAVCALNPHAGEEGLFGEEEQTMIAPAVRQFSQATAQVAGPLPVDTLIRRAVAGEFDGVVAMYHDQGHIPVKLLGFDAAVNITLGLPIVRTSPTHGTAYDRAWNPTTPADPAGMIESVLTAARLCR